MLRHRRSTAIAAVIGVLVALLAPPAHAAGAGTPVGAAKHRPSLTVTPVRGLDPAGAVVTVTGTHFTPTVGVYVALCVTPAPGQRPGPCGGGVNMSGTDPSSFWISSNPPAYGRKLAKPFNRNGGFTVRLRVSSTIGDIDCRTTSCAIVTRADHLHPTNRGSDVIVPVTFAP